MKRLLRHLGAAAVLAGVTLAGACSQTPMVVPLRSMERPKDVDFICLQQRSPDQWVGASLDKCMPLVDPNKPTGYHLHAVVTQMSRGELAVADVGAYPEDATSLIKVDPRIPGYSFLPVGAVPTDVVADPGGQAVYVASGRDPRVDIIPAALLRGPIDTTAEQGDSSPWPHIALDPTDGIAGALTIVREGDTRKLYVMLPEAKPQSKVAVYDLTETPLAPVKLQDIVLDFGDAPPLTVAGTACGPDKLPAPWWVPSYDECFGPVTTVTPAAITAPPITEMHLSGLAVAGKKIFAADDKAPVIHVFDADTGREERRIPVGTPLSRISVSPAVPDEVDINNQPGIDVCEVRGWFGDGIDHSADAPTIAQTLASAGGKCRLHRYLYGIDLFNPVAGNGSIAVVDIPITYPAGPTGLDRANEQLDFAGASLVQAMACDSPSLPKTRVPLGNFGLAGGPTRAVTFVTVDPPTPTIAIPAARCRAWADGSQPTGVAELTPADGITPEQRSARIAAGEFWRNGAGPSRLRGTFAFAALANGAVVVVDIDDYDALCRGPRDAADRLVNGLDIFEYPNVLATPLGPFATGEYYSRPVQRHHPRSFRFFDGNTVPAISVVTLSDPNGPLNNDPLDETGKKRPNFAPMAHTSDNTPVFAIPSADNPLPVTSEQWTVTYEGQLPGFTGNLADIQPSGANLLLTDSSGAFCTRGVEDVGPAHDAVQLLDDTCLDSVGCTDAVKEQCHQVFGDGTEFPLKPTRTLTILNAFEDKLVLAPNGADLAKCFGVGTGHGPLLRYGVRSSGSWVVIGSTTGYLSRRIVDPASPEKACITDTNKSHVYEGRVRVELPPLDNTSASFTKAGEVSRTCDPSKPGQPSWFENPAWAFAIRRGTEPSVQGMTFTFTSRFAWAPFAISAGSLPQSIKTMNAQWDGREQLGWNMIAVVDAIDKGLYMFTAGAPLSFAKGVN